MSDDHHPDTPPTDGSPFDPESFLRGELLAAVDGSASDTDALSTLVETAGRLCDELAHQAYGDDDWTCDRDRETYAHLMLTLDRMCGHLHSGLGHLAAGDREGAWALLDGAARCRQEVTTTVAHDESVDDELAAGYASVLDTAAAGDPVALTAAESLMADLLGAWVHPVTGAGVGPTRDPAVVRVGLVSRTRAHRTPSVFLDESRLDGDFVELSAALLLGAVTEVAGLASAWNLGRFPMAARVLRVADAARRARFEPRRAA